MIENCPMRHENGNCIPAGGFCTANKNICEALLNAYRMGKAQLSPQGTTSDLISRQAVINAIENTNAKMSMPEWDEITNAVMSLPPAQPEPQEGHWIRTDCGLDVECKCSRCGYKDFVSPHDTYWFKRNYCPNCGAKMKGVRHESN